jgi:hypothetical protein
LGISIPSGQSTNYRGKPGAKPALEVMVLHGTPDGDPATIVHAYMIH